MERKSFLRNLLGASLLPLIPKVLKDIAPVVESPALPLTPGYGSTSFTIYLSRSDFHNGDIIVSKQLGEYYIWGDKAINLQTHENADIKWEAEKTPEYSKLVFSTTASYDQTI